MEPSKPESVSDELERWLTTDPDKTVGSLIALFEEKSFALLSSCCSPCPPCRCRPAGRRTSSS